MQVILSDQPNILTDLIILVRLRELPHEGMLLVPRAKESTVCISLVTKAC